MDVKDKKEIFWSLEIGIDTEYGIQIHTVTQMFIQNPSGDTA